MDATEREFTEIITGLTFEEKLLLLRIISELKAEDAAEREDS